MLSLLLRFIQLIHPKFPAVRYCVTTMISCFQNIRFLLTFGEDTGNIGGVNQSLEGLQKKFGELRITDTGIREATILGQGLGLALRGMRPIAEIQYLDYLMYALQVLSDDLATTHYRTAGQNDRPTDNQYHGDIVLKESGTPVLR